MQEQTHTPAVLNKWIEIYIYIQQKQNDHTQLYSLNVLMAIRPFFSRITFHVIYNIFIYILLNFNLGIYLALNIFIERERGIITARNVKIYNQVYIS